MIQKSFSRGEKSTLIKENLERFSLFEDVGEVVYRYSAHIRSICATRRVNKGSDRFEIFKSTSSVSDSPVSRFSRPAPLGAVSFLCPSRKALRPRHRARRTKERLDRPSHALLRAREMDIPYRGRRAFSLRARAHAP